MTATLKDVLAKLSEYDSKNYEIKYKFGKLLIVLYKTCKKTENQRIDYFYYDDFTVEICWTNE